MLVLSRYTGEEIIETRPDGTEVIVTVLAIGNGKVKLGFTAPKDIAIDRREVRERIKAEVNR